MSNFHFLLQQRRPPTPSQRRCGCDRGDCGMTMGPRPCRHRCPLLPVPMPAVLVLQLRRRRRRRRCGCCWCCWCCCCDRYCWPTVECTLWWCLAAAGAAAGAPVVHESPQSTTWHLCADRTTHAHRECPPSGETRAKKRERETHKTETRRRC